LTHFLGGSLEGTGFSAEIIEAARQLEAECGLPVRMIGLDHAGLIHGGEFNAREDVVQTMRQVNHIAQETGAAVLVLAHSPKAAAAAEKSSAGAVAGSTAWVDHARGALVLRAMNDEEGTPTLTARRNTMKFEDIPAHVRASMSAAEKLRNQIILDGPKLGHPWITTHRRIEVLAGTPATLKHIAGYFPHEALATLDRFAKTHWRRPAEKGSDAESTMNNRIKVFYPDLFSNLRCRLTALLEIPQCAVLRKAFETLEAAFLFDLTAADRLARNLEGAQKRNRRHDDYRLAFANIYDDLRDLLLELVAIGEAMQQRG
jgi:hypothetical protein